MSGSVHLIHGQDPYYRGFFEGRSGEEAYHEAFEVTVENLKKIDSFVVWDIWTMLSVMAHIRQKDILIENMQTRSMRY